MHASTDGLIRAKISWGGVCSAYMLGGNGILKTSYWYPREIATAGQEGHEIKLFWQEYSVISVKNE